MTDPVVLNDPDHGVSYERRALEEWVDRTGYVHSLHLRKYQPLTVPSF